MTRMLLKAALLGWLLATPLLATTDQAVSPDTIEAILDASNDVAESKQSSRRASYRRGETHAEDTPVGLASSSSDTESTASADQLLSGADSASTGHGRDTLPAESLESPGLDVSLPTWESLTSPERIAGNVRLVAAMAALSLAPALLLMTTCYVRIAVVLALLRQALGLQQVPSNQVTTALSLFLTVLIMFPVWKQVHDEAIKPYADPATKLSAEEAWAAGVKPVHDFMSKQISRAGNHDDVRLFLEYLQLDDVEYYPDVPIQALLPAFLLSELKVAFLLGFQIFLPFVIVDLVVSSVTMSMGMVMVPPTTLSLPLKLLLFVLVDGWHLVVEMLLMSFRIV